MDPTTFTAALMDKAASHLHAAAEHADSRADHDHDADPDVGGDPRFWSGLAGQLRLVGAGLSITAPTAQVTPRPFGIQDHLDAALTALDQIAPLDGPPDLQLWAWQVAHLRRGLDTVDGQP